MECRKRKVGNSTIFLLLFVVKLKHILMRQRIVKLRLNAAIRIIVAFREYLNKIREQKINLMKRIIKSRSVHSTYLQKQLKMLIFRKRVREIIQKKNDYYCLVCNIKNAKKINLLVWLKDGTKKSFDFEFCKIRKVFVLYIQRKLAHGSIYKVHFIADDKVVIDPMYRTDYDEHGNFFNLIDFFKIEQDEANQQEDKERIVKYHAEKMMKERAIEENYFRTLR